MSNNTLIEQQARYLISDRTAATRRPQPRQTPDHHRRLRRLSWL